MQLDELYLTIVRKEEKSGKIFKCKHRTYIVNILKFEYHPLDKPRITSILTFLVCQLVA